MDTRTNSVACYYHKEGMLTITINSAVEPNVANNYAVTLKRAVKKGRLLGILKELQEVVNDL